jgi:hypothetical protein
MQCSLLVFGDPAKNSASKLLVEADVGKGYAAVVPLNKSLSERFMTYSRHSKMLIDRLEMAQFRQSIDRQKSTFTGHPGVYSEL